jgi:Domain of unknown function (DUF4129)
LVIAVAMIVIVVIAIANKVGSKYRNLIQRLISGNSRPQHGKQPKVPPRLHLVGAIHDANIILYSLVGLIVLAAIVVCVILVLRARARVLRPGGYADDAPEPPADELRQAVDSGRAALRAVDDARAAIIACYVAMEGSLASAGSARTAAETPDELLTRAAASGLIRSQAAGRLTGLFYEARFSTHPIAATARDAARQALDAIAAEVADQSRRSRPAAEPAR